MTFPRIDEDFMDTQLSTFGEMEPEHELVNPKMSSAEIDKIIREDMLAIQVSTYEGSMALIEDSFPRIAQMIRSGWGSMHLHLKLSNMLQVDSNDRAGFDTNIGYALMKVYQTHMDEFKFVAPGIVDGYSQDRW